MWPHTYCFLCQWRCHRRGQLQSLFLVSQNRSLHHYRKAVVRPHEIYSKRNRHDLPPTAQWYGLGFQQSPKQWFPVETQAASSPFLNSHLLATNTSSVGCRSTLEKQRIQYHRSVLKSLLRFSNADSNSPIGSWRFRSPSHQCKPVVNWSLALVDNSSRKTAVPSYRKSFVCYCM